MNDRELITELDALLNRLDPVPERVLADARAAFELSLVTTDWTVLAEVQEPAVRSGRRRLRFGGGPVSVVVELHRVPWRLNLIGVVAADAEVAEIDVRWPFGAVPVVPDETGVFRAELLPRGPLRVVVRVAGGESFATPWFRA
jgi:hypothetical protein